MMLKVRGKTQEWGNPRIKKIKYSEICLKVHLNLEITLLRVKNQIKAEIGKDRISSSLN